MGKEFEEMMKELAEHPIDINELEAEINAKIAELEEKDTIEVLGEAVAKINEKDNLDTNDRELFDMFLTIKSCFSMIKEKYAEDSTEYTEAKDLLMSINEKHPSLYNKISAWIEK